MAQATIVDAEVKKEMKQGTRGKHPDEFMKQLHEESAAYGAPDNTHQAGFHNGPWLKVSIVTGEVQIDKRDEAYWTMQQVNEQSDRPNLYSGNSMFYTSTGAVKTSAEKDFL